MNSGLERAPWCARQWTEMALALLAATMLGACVRDNPSSAAPPARATTQGGAVPMNQVIVPMSPFAVRTLRQRIRESGGTGQIVAPASAAPGALSAAPSVAPDERALRQAIHAASATATIPSAAASGAGPR